MRKIVFPIFIFFVIQSTVGCKTNTGESSEMTESQESMEVGSFSDVESEVKIPTADGLLCTTTTDNVLSNMEVDVVGVNVDEPNMIDIVSESSSKTEPDALPKTDIEQLLQADATDHSQLIADSPLEKLVVRSNSDAPLSVSGLPDLVSSDLTALGDGTSDDGLQISREFEGEDYENKLSDFIGLVDNGTSSNVSEDAISVPHEETKFKDDRSIPMSGEQEVEVLVEVPFGDKETEVHAISSCKGEVDVAKEVEALTETASRDSEKIEQDFEKMNQDSEKMNQDSEKIEQDSEKIEQDSEKIEQDFEKINQDSEKINQDSKKIEQDSEKFDQVSELDVKSYDSSTGDAKNEELSENISRPLDGAEADFSIESGKLESGYGSDLKSQTGVEGECAEGIMNKDSLPSQVESGDDDDGELLGFHFNNEGELRDKFGKKFEFRYSENQEANQKRYEDLGEKITEYVYKLLERDCKLRRHNIPFNPRRGDPQGFFFASEGAQTTSDKLLILIHGNGVVRAGQWARKIIINDNLRDGTQIPYIEKAMAEGYEIVVLNTNQNTVPPDIEIPCSEDPEKHALYVWDNFIMKSKAKNIAIVAHSYGGVVTVELACQRRSQFLKRIFAIALTDSVHNLRYSDATSEIIEFFELHGMNWVSSDLPLDKPVETSWRRTVGDAPQMSAGDKRHEWTSTSSIHSVFKFLSTEYKIRLNSSSSSCQTF